jgi:hypothetical protein
MNVRFGSLSESNAEATMEGKAMEGKAMEGKAMEGKAMEGKQQRRASPLPAIDSSDSSSSEDDDPPSELSPSELSSPPKIPRRRGSHASSNDQSSDDDAETMSPRALVPPRRKQHHEIRLQAARLRRKRQKEDEDHQNHLAIQAGLFARQRERNKQQQQQQEQQQQEQQQQQQQQQSEKKKKQQQQSIDVATVPNSPVTPMVPARKSRRKQKQNKNTTARHPKRGDSSLNALTPITGTTETKVSVGEISDTGSVATADSFSSTTATDIDDVLALGRDCCKECASLLHSGKKKIKTLPELLQVLNALLLDLNGQADNLSDYHIGQQPKVVANLETLVHALHETSALLSRIGGSRRLRIDLPNYHSLNRKFRNKVSRAARSVDNCKHALVTSLLMAMNDHNKDGTNDVRLSSRALEQHGSGARSSAGSGVGSRSNSRSNSRPSKRRFQAAEEKCMLGDRFFSGLGVDQNMRLSHRNYLLAAEAGLVRAMNCVGCMYARGLGTTVDLEAARHWFNTSARNNDPEGMYHLATLLDDRVSSNRRVLLAHGGRAEAYRTAVVKTMRDIETWLLKASELGHPGAMNALASLYEHADPVGTAGITRDCDKALRWYRKAAELDYPVAQNNMGSFCYVGKPPMKGPDYEQARVWFERAAEQCDPVGK